MDSMVSRLSQSVYRLGPLGNPRVLSSYLITDNKIAIIDCGPSSAIQELVENIKSLSIDAADIDFLALTHIHLDHAGGAADFLKVFPNAKVLVPERGYKHLIDPKILNASSRPILGEHIFNSWGECKPVPADKLEAVKPFQTLELGETALQYVPATGHAPHHNILTGSKDSIIFCADGLGMFDDESQSLTPTTPPPSFDMVQALKDIDMIEQMKAQKLCLAHFHEIQAGTQFFDKVRLAYRSWAEITSKYVEKNAQRSSFELSDYEKVFSEIVDKFPEYGRLPEFLKEQVLRVDVGGLLNHYSKPKRSP